MQRLISLRARKIVLFGGLGILGFVLFNVLTKGPKTASPVLPVVTLGQPRIEDIEIPFQGSSQLTATASVDIKARLSSIVKHIAVSDGAFVEKNQLLIQLDDAALQAKVAQAEATEKKVEAQLIEARQEIARTSQLLKRKYATQAQYDQQVATVKAFEADLANARASLSELRTQLDYTQIRAPFSGRASITPIAEGAVVGPNDTQALLSINQVDPMELLLAVPEQHLAQLTPLVGTTLKVNLRLADQQMIEVEATLKAMDNRVDPTTGTIKVAFSLPNPEGRLFAGQFAELSFSLRKLHQALVIPAEALRNSQKGEFVYVYDAGQQMVQARPVQVAAYLEKIVVLENGLSADEKIVTNGFGRITDGSQVQVVEETSSSKERS
ncbi:MAG: efflux RND transporter periplasmic adaptor subunit [Holosporales bacterium]